MMDFSNLVFRNSQIKLVSLGVSAAVLRPLPPLVPQRESPLGLVGQLLELEVRDHEVSSLLDRLEDVTR